MASSYLHPMVSGRQQLLLGNEGGSSAAGRQTGGSADFSDLTFLTAPGPVPSAVVHHHQHQVPVSRSPDCSLTPGLLSDEWEPQARDRSNTWPLRRPDPPTSNNTSPLIYEQIQEEDDDLQTINADGQGPSYDRPQTPMQLQQSFDVDLTETLVDLDEQRHLTVLASSNGSQPYANGGDMRSPGDNSQSSELLSPQAMSDNSDPGTSAHQQQQQFKKANTRRNAWGNLSYADLITQAIASSPEKRLTLAQIYEWMIQNVPYFRDKGDSNSSAGWKNSIRHNLSLHSRFMRIQNEGAGKSSWWVINPDAKPGRSPRRPRDRAATADTAHTKAVLERKKNRVRKRVAELREQGKLGVPTEGVVFDGSEQSSLAGSQASLQQDGQLFDDELRGCYRPRAQSNLSIPGVSVSSTRVSPTLDHQFDDFPTFDWKDANVPPDILSRTDQITLDQQKQQQIPFHNGTLSQSRQPTVVGENGHVLNGGGLSASVKFESCASPVPNTSPMKFEPVHKPHWIKSESGQAIQPPPSYHELSTVLRNQPAAHMQNPLLRGQFQQQLHQQQQQQQYYQQPQQGQQYFNGMVSSNGPCHQGVTTWVPNGQGGVTCAQQQAGLFPADLLNISLPDQQPGMELVDVEAVLRQELAQLPRGGKLDFGPNL